MRVNGAATGWPRKDVFTCFLCFHAWRQWGRDRMAAEGSQALTDWLSGSGRQWGRDRMAAEGR